MHDPTEGGIAGAIHEMADASKTGVTIHEDRIRVEDETQQICNFFNIDPLQLIASGCLLIAVDPNSAQRIMKALATNSIGSETIGEFTSFPEQRRIVLRGGRPAELVRPKTDHLWRALAQ
jgi:hydrogenase maturation factor